MPQLCRVGQRHLGEIGQPDAVRRETHDAETEIAVRRLMPRQTRLEPLGPQGRPLPIDSNTCSE